MASKPKTRTNSYGWVIYKVLKSYQDYYCLQKGAIHSALPSPWVGTKSSLPPIILTKLSQITGSLLSSLQFYNVKPTRSILLCHANMFLNHVQGLHNLQERDQYSTVNDMIHIIWYDMIMIWYGYDMITIWYDMTINLIINNVNLRMMVECFLVWCSGEIWVVSLPRLMYRTPSRSSNRV